MTGAPGVSGYSEAERCAGCDRRAILTRAAAERFVSISGGLLVMFRCPDRLGWHLYNPVGERGRHTA
jgi:hypothetical protein